MRVLKWLLGLLGALVLVFVVVGFLLPRQVHVERDVVIDAAPGEVFPYVNSLKAGADWSPWLGRDPLVVLEYAGPDEGVGARLNWASDQRDVGVGSQEIILSELDQRVQTALDFGDMGLATAEFLLSPEGEGTRVVWSLDADMGAGPVGRWMGLMMDGWVGGDYERGLANLKELVESR